MTAQWITLRIAQLCALAQESIGISLIALMVEELQ